MYRYASRLSVTLVTFAIGLLVSAVPSLFNRTPHVYVRARHVSCHRDAGNAPSPVMSIGTQPNEPLKILYVSTSLDPADPGKRQVHFLVENKSDRDIKGFTIKYHLGWSSNTRGGGDRVSVVADSQGQVFGTEESQVVTINCDADQLLNLWLNSAEFTDGSHWNSVPLSE
jgi:hypothetical protein